MNARRLTVIAVIAALGLGGVGFGLNHRSQNACAVEAAALLGPEGGGPLGLRKSLEKLDLTEKQRNEIKAIVREEFPKVEPKIRQMVAARRALRAAIQQEELNEKLIRERAAAVADLASDLAVERARVRQRVVAHLTDAQKETLISLQKDADRRVDAFLIKLGEKIQANH
jgi:Spy/CpxP family protein refolding chaperone